MSYKKTIRKIIKELLKNEDYISDAFKFAKIQGIKDKQMRKIVNKQYPISFLSEHNILKCTDLKEQVLECLSLKVLDLSHNNLTSIPETLGNLTNLRGLDLSHNNLSSIPETLGELKKLQWLDLSHNNLTCVPETLGNLTNLRGLYLYNNNLTSIPENLKKILL